MVIYMWVCEIFVCVCFGRTQHANQTGWEHLQNVKMCIINFPIPQPPDKPADSVMFLCVMFFV